MLFTAMKGLFFLEQCLKGTMVCFMGSAAFRGVTRVGIAGQGRAAEAAWGVLRGLCPRGQKGHILCWCKASSPGCRQQFLSHLLSSAWWQHFWICHHCLHPLSCFSGRGSSGSGPAGSSAVGSSRGAEHGASPQRASPRCSPPSSPQPPCALLFPSQFLL